MNKAVLPMTNTVRGWSQWWFWWCRRFGGFDGAEGGFGGLKISSQVFGGGSSSRNPETLLVEFVDSSEAALKNRPRLRYC